MSIVSFTTLDVTFERWSDHLNPVLVKEVRQVLKSRGFAGAFLLLLGVTFAASVVMVLAAGSQIEYGEPGAAFLSVYLCVLMLILCFVVPLTVFRSAASEFDARTFESLAVTTLSAQRIVWGKLQSACVQLVVYCSAVAPFVCFTYLLGGIGLPAILAALVIAAVSSVTVCLGGLMLGSLTRGGAGQIFATLLLLAWGGVVATVGTGMATSVVSTAIGWGDIASLVAGFACLSYAGLFYGMLTLGVSFNQFTPSIQDRPAPLSAPHARRQRQRRTEQFVAAHQPSSAESTNRATS